MRPARALLSVTDKTGLVDLAAGLSKLGVELVSTGGTGRLLGEHGLPVTDVSAVTGFPEMLDGRVKTLHPHVHAGILARMDDPAHVATLAARGLTPIGLVVVNLYAFDRAVERGLSPEATIEEIDIGGPSLLRAAAKNHASVLVVADPADYPLVLQAIEAGTVDLALRRRLAKKAFQHTARYDAAIAAYFAELSSDERFPGKLSFGFDRVQELRYGENPHQAAAVYAAPGASPRSLARAPSLQGKALSYNNLLDADSALLVALDLPRPGCVYVKHNNPCGAATGATLAEAIERARAVDSVSAFGAVVAVNEPVDVRAAEILAETFLEVVVAPGFHPDAKRVLEAKKNLRLLEVDDARRGAGFELRRIDGGLLVQDRDHGAPLDELTSAKVVTARAPTDDEWAGLRFAWTLVKHVRSNAIVFSRSDRLLAVGAGQMSRVDAVAICRLKAGDRLRGSVAASDAFFPFRDGLDTLAEAGATAVVQPGGSVRDDEVIAAANERGVAMVFTGVRHFRH